MTSLREHLLQYLHEQVPLTRAMELDVVSASFEQVILSAPLAPNINHLQTVFGGSISAIAILAAWGLLHVRLRELKIQKRLLISRNQVEYVRPARGAFQAQSEKPSEDDWGKFVQRLERTGRGRITLSSIVKSNDENIARLRGDFVAID